MNIANANGATAGTPCTTKTFCRICTAVCGLDVVTENDKIVSVLPDRTHPYSWRDYCAKGASAGALRDHPERLTRPMKRVGDRYVESTYEEAVADIAARLGALRAQYGANSIATYIGNPALLNSPNGLCQAGFMAGIGSASAFSVGSIDQNNFHVVAQAMYGCEMTTLIPDVDHAKCFLFIGMNPAISTMGWLDTVPDGWKRILAAQKNGADLIVVDPRQTPTTRKADTHVLIRPGEDWAFLLGLINVVFEQGWAHMQDCAEATGTELIRSIALQSSLDELSARCGVSVEQIRDVARRFATAETSVCVARTGVSQNRNGSLGEWLSHVLNLVCGRIDKKGGRYYQPGMFKNTMKVLNSLAPPVARRSRIGGYRAVQGAYPLAILPDEITTPGPDQVRALIINSGNPVVSGPDGARLDVALQQLDLLVAIDFFQRESHRHAHWIIPGSHFLEREEFFALFGGMIYDKPFAQLGQAAIAPRDGIKLEWEFFCDLTLAMKRPFFGLRGFNTIIRLSRQLARVTGNPHHAFNPRWIWALLTKMLSRVKWRDIVSNPQGLIYGDVEYGQFRSALQTADGRIQAAPPLLVTALQQRLAEPVTQGHPSFPLQLVNQRRLSMMNSWLVETVTHRRSYGDVVEINRFDAEARAIEHGQKVIVTSRAGAVELHASISDEVPPGIVSIDHGWGSRVFDPVGGAAPKVQGINRNLLVAADEIDELAGTPNLNGTHVEVRAA